MVRAEDLQKLVAWAQHHRLALFPIPKFCKRPTGIVHSHATGWSTDPQQWRRWWDENQGCNFGVACGPSRLIVVDVDVDPAGFPYRDEFARWIHAPYAATVATPSFGEHVYYRVPDTVDSGALRQPDILPGKINTRAGRGYVVAPWCVAHPDADNGVKRAGVYTATMLLTSPDYDLFMTAPQRLIEHCSPGRVDAPIVPRQDVVVDASGLPLDPVLRRSVDDRMRAILEPLRQAVPGERNNRLNEASFAAGKLVAEGVIAQGLAEQMVWEAAFVAGIARDEPKAQSTVRSGMRAAPRVGQAEPRSAMHELLAYEVPVTSFTRPVRNPSGTRQDLILAEPIVERLLYEGEVTVLSGGSGTGKTTLGASLAAAATTGVRHFAFGGFETGDLSDVFCRPAAWLFLNYEGGQHIQRNTQAWHVGTGASGLHPERFRVVDLDDGPLVGTVRRDAFVREQHVTVINRELLAIRDACPDVPVVLVVDNVTAAVEDSMDSTQAQMFVRSMRAIAGTGVAVLAFAHPPKAQSSAVYGSHVFFSMPDIVAVMEVLREENGERVQWIDFPKHRREANGECLQVRSRRLSRPLVELPAEWGADNPRARDRQIRNLHVPYVRSIAVKDVRQKSAGVSGVVESVSAKASSTVAI